MALRFCDSFDHYATADQLSKWTTEASANLSVISAANGRNGTQALRTSGASTGGGLSKTLGSEASWVLGVAVKFSNITATSFLHLTDAGTAQLDVRISAGGLLQVTRSGTVLATGTTVLSVGVYYYIEFKCTIHDTTGSFELRVNGVTEVSGSGVDTKNTANASADQVALKGNSNNSMDFDDFYICDANGGVNTDFLGDVRVQALLPTGNGNSSQLVGSDGNSTDNYLLVDEVPPNEDTDYVESATVNDKDTYVFGNLTPTTGTVFGVQIVAEARKTDAGVRSFKSVARLSATEADGPDTTLSTTYAFYMDKRDTKPGGGSWTITNVNDAEFGVKVTA